MAKKWKCVSGVKPILIFLSLANHSGANRYDPDYRPDENTPGCGAG